MRYVPRTYHVGLRTRLTSPNFRSGQKPDAAEEQSWKATQQRGVMRRAVSWGGDSSCWGTQPLASSPHQCLIPAGPPQPRVTRHFEATGLAPAPPGSAPLSASSAVCRIERRCIGTLLLHSIGAARPSSFPVAQANATSVPRGSHANPSQCSHLDHTAGTQSARPHAGPAAGRGTGGRAKSEP